MTEQTSRLELPYILPSQAQKHVTHNEALQKLDAVTQLTIRREISQPPQTMEDGDCFLIASVPTGEWERHGGKLGLWQDDAWVYIVPREGWRAWFLETGQMRVLSNGNWQDIPLPAAGAFGRLGINASADPQNRLTVASPASLFTNEGGGHQIKVNKAAPTDTASLLFQSGWSGRAEMGLAGNDSFSIKMSANGVDWKTALSISGAGHVSLPERPLVRAGRAVETVSHTAGTISGFTDLPVQQGGFALGNSVVDVQKDLVVPLTGLYLITLTLSVVASSGHTVTLRINDANSSFALAGTTSAENSTQSASFIVSLNEKDRISLAHGGACQLAYGAGKTELLVAAL
ncbi:hypothetical protein GGQ73_001921 [Rhizobium skierniewicense]|uniref:DUF2793 domain-containing protein n=1 Tax=Rhizobium skierniewicense TaxID=984260 RepID=A0A7W6CCG3_9HYPH|nr:DUF2793 domain-containing protein [Rhizobium skierniewicense]MBB3945975.1 hypothetical protein [Rhizobium skierniewicense]NTF32740.1 DUF2793 domain-containing protein [Rhizobium skierniewicense]